MKGLFVTGTDTGVGKTVVSAWLMLALDGEYWKPVQTGLSEGETDTHTVRRLTGLPDARFHHPVYEFEAPLSPHAAARLENVTISLEDFSLPESPEGVRRPVVVEGAGGVLVPLNDTELMTDLMARLGLPVVVVARTGLGTINHSLLSLEALRGRGVELAGVVFSGPPDAGNREAVACLGRVRVLGELPLLDPLDADGLAAAVSDFPLRLCRGGHG